MPTWIEANLRDTSPYFYPVIFFSLLLAGLGFPISADLVLLSVGYLAYRGQANYAILIPLCLGAILLSDTLMYSIARNAGPRLLTLWPFRTVATPERIASAEASFHRYGYRMVFLARFMPGVRTVFMFTSGLLRLRYRKFLIHDFAGGAIVVPSVIYSVKAAAGNQEVILTALKRGQGIVLVLFLAAVVIFYRMRRRPTL